MNFTADQIIGKTLYAKKAVKLYKLADTNSQLMATISPGGVVGVVYSYIMRGGALWWQMADFTYCKHEPGLFDIKKLTDQGAIDVETLNAPSLTDQANAALSALLSGLKWAIPAVLILFAIYWSIKTYNLTK